MIRVTTEIVPYGDETQKRTIGVMEIARTSLSGDPEDYNVWSYEPRTGELKEQFQVIQHPYAHGAVNLVRRAFECLWDPKVR